MFRFEGLEIWRRSVIINDKLFDIADSIEDRKKYRFAEQLRSASLSISNNIAEGAGSVSKKDFKLFLTYSHRSVFECVNMLIIAGRRNYISQQEMQSLKNELEEISKMLIGFGNTLK